MNSAVRPAQAPGDAVALPTLLLAMLAAYLFGLAWAMEHTSYDVWGALLVGPALVLVTVPIAARIARREADRRMARLVVGALVLKLLASLARYAMAFGFYGGYADAAGYDEIGRRLAPLYRVGDFSADVGPLVGTALMRALTGLVYAVIGPTSIGGFLVFSWLGFWGLYLFYRAFRLALPGGDARRYALLVLLLPSLLFWPSSIGKEAVITLTLGLTAYGAARLFARRRGAFLFVAAGLAGTTMVRPHVGLVVFVALVVGYLIPRTGVTSPFAPLTKAIGIALLLSASVLLVTQLERFLGLEKLDSRSAEQALMRAQKNTAQGGSEFESTGRVSLAQLPAGIVTILFRPFPFEAHNVPALIASLEGAVLLVLFVRARHSVLSALRRARSSPYVAMACAHALLFTVAFSSFGNFGIIVRQRVQVLPFVLVLLAVPHAGASKSRARHDASRERWHALDQP